MSDDFIFAELFPVSELPAKLPPLPKGDHATSKVYNWLNLSNDPTRRTLRSILIGRYRYTCDRWLREFLNNSTPSQNPRPTPGQRQRHRDKIKRELQEAGL